MTADIRRTSGQLAVEHGVPSAESSNVEGIPWAEGF